VSWKIPLHPIKKTLVTLGLKILSPAHTMTGVLTSKMSCIWPLLLYIVSYLPAPVKASFFNSKGGEISSLVPSTDHHKEQRSLITNGDDAIPENFPFFVHSAYDGVQITTDFFCGASLIHSDIILTAAHCQGAFNFGAVVYNPTMNMFNIRVGVDRQVAHPGYFAETDYINSDLMVLRLNQPQTDIQPVILNSDPNFPEPYVDQMQAAGFGAISYPDTTFPLDLQVGYFSSMTTIDCTSRIEFSNVRLGDDIICTDPITDDSSCSGDSGGPLIIPMNFTSQIDQIAVGRELNSSAVQVGITSFGIDCVGDSIPDGFTRVSYYYNWIVEQVCILSSDPPEDCPTILANAAADAAANGETQEEEEAIIQITLQFRHDFSAEDTTFAVRDTSKNKIKFVGPQYIPVRGQTVESTFLLAPGNYAFEVYDSRGNGLTNPDFASATYPDGGWTLNATYWNGATAELAADDGVGFTTVQVTRFRVDEKAPDVAITSTPTQSPSIPIATSGPSASPSDTIFTLTIAPTVSAIVSDPGNGGVDLPTGVVIDDPSSSSPPSPSSSVWSGTFYFIVSSMIFCAW
jgi:secreted trypsin-like serine protease